MDPDATLKLARLLMEEASQALANGSNAEQLGSHDAAAEFYDQGETALRQAARTYNYLDAWLSDGGFPPDAWAKRERSLTEQLDKLTKFVREVADTSTAMEDVSCAFWLCSFVDDARALLKS